MLDVRDEINYSSKKGKAITEKEAIYNHGLKIESYPMINNKGKVND